MIDIRARVLSSNDHQIKLIVGSLCLRHNRVSLDLLRLILEDTLTAERVSGYSLINTLIIQ